MLKYILPFLLVATTALAQEGLRPGETVTMPSGEVITVDANGIFHATKKTEIDVRTKPKDALPVLEQQQPLTVVEMPAPVIKKETVPGPDGTKEVRTSKTTILPDDTEVVVMPGGEEIAVKKTEIKPATTEIKNNGEAPATQPTTTTSAPARTNEENLIIYAIIAGVVALFALSRIKRKPKVKPESKVSVTVTPRVTWQNGLQDDGDEMLEGLIEQRKSAREALKANANGLGNLIELPKLNSLKAPPVWNVVPPPKPPMGESI